MHCHSVMLIPIIVPTCSNLEFQNTRDLGHYVESRQMILKRPRKKNQVVYFANIILVVSSMWYTQNHRQAEQRSSKLIERQREGVEKEIKRKWRRIKEKKEQRRHHCAFRRNAIILMFPVLNRGTVTYVGLCVICLSVWDLTSVFTKYKWTLLISPDVFVPLVPPSPAPIDNRVYHSLLGHLAGDWTEPVILLSVSATSDNNIWLFNAYIMVTMRILP